MLEKESEGLVDFWGWLVRCGVSFFKVYWVGIYFRENREFKGKEEGWVRG